MPQFDKITFFNQLFWLLFFFSGFYLVLVHYFLPKLGAVLKARVKMLRLCATGVSALLGEHSQVRNSSKQVCSFVLTRKNAECFLTQFGLFGEWVKQSASALFTQKLTQGLAKSESRTYRQVLLLQFLGNLGER